MFDRFSDRARKVMNLARQAAQRFNHRQLGTEHILLGLAQDGAGVAACVLRNRNIDFARIRGEVEKLVETGPPTETVVQLPFSPGSRKALEFSMEEAGNLGHNYIGTEHLLLGLIKENEGIAAKVLTKLGVKLEDVREEVLEVLGSENGDEEVTVQSASWTEGRKTGPRGAVPPHESRKLRSLLPAVPFEIARGTALVMLPRQPEFALHERAIQPALTALGTEAFATSDVPETEALLPRVWEALHRAEILVADVSEGDPSVLHALGLCHGIGRAPLLLARTGTTLLWELRGWRLSYERSEAGVARLRTEIEAVLRTFWGFARGEDTAP